MPEEEPPSVQEDARPPFVRVTPPQDFIAQYVEAALRRTDAPREAHELSAALVLSALAGPRIRLPLAYQIHGVSLVCWGMNLVDSTIGRKTRQLVRHRRDPRSPRRGSPPPLEGQPRGLHSGFRRPGWPGGRVRTG
jgi:hypothetical protein